MDTFGIAVRFQLLSVFKILKILKTIQITYHSRYKTVFHICTSRRDSTPVKYFCFQKPRKFHRDRARAQAWETFPVRKEIDDATRICHRREVRELSDKVKKQQQYSERQNRKEMKRAVYAWTPQRVNRPRRGRNELEDNRPRILSWFVEPS